MWSICSLNINICRKSLMDMLATLIRSEIDTGSNWRLLKEANLKSQYWILWLLLANQSRLTLIPVSHWWEKYHTCSTRTHRASKRTVKRWRTAAARRGNDLAFRIYSCGFHAFFVLLDPLELSRTISDGGRGRCGAYLVHSSHIVPKHKVLHRIESFLGRRELELCSTAHRPTHPQATATTVTSNSACTQGPKVGE